MSQAQDDLVARATDPNAELTTLHELAQNYPDLRPAGLLPHLVKELECPVPSYLCLTPTADFQKKHYRQREWVPYTCTRRTWPTANAS